MLDCPECHRLKYSIDVAATVAVHAATYFLRLADNAPEYSLALMSMRRAKSVLEACELEWEGHVSSHAKTRERAPEATLKAAAISTASHLR